MNIIVFLVSFYYLRLWF